MPGAQNRLHHLPQQQAGAYLIIVKHEKVRDTGERVANEEFEQTALVAHHDAGGDAVWTTRKTMVVCGR